MSIRDEIFAFLERQAGEPSPARRDHFTRPDADIDLTDPDVVARVNQDLDYTSSALEDALAAERDAMVLVDAFTALSYELSAEAAAATACRHARKLSRAKRVRLLMLDDNDQPQVVACSPSGSHPATRDYLPTNGIAKAVADEICITGTRNDRSSVLVPLRCGGTVGGVMELTYHRGRPVAPQRVLRLCEALATVAGTAIDRATRTDELQRQAVTDSLTGLDNRRQLVHDLEHEVARTTRSREALTVIMIDLDNFKAFNDSHGHVAGDRCLQAFGRYLGSAVRAVDIAGRYGGEEFLIILPDTDSNLAYNVGNRIRQTWKRAEQSVTFSAGIAQLQPGESWTQLVQRADAALYRAKDDGRDCVVVADDTLVGGHDHRIDVRVADGAAVEVDITGEIRRRRDTARRAPTEPSGNNGPDSSDQAAATVTQLHRRNA